MIEETDQEGEFGMLAYFLFVMSMCFWCTL